MQSAALRRAILSVAVALLLVAGLAFTLSSVDRRPFIRDIDEAAWIFNGRFLDLYLSGDWRSPDWNAFDKYANHPPVGAYLFGLLEHAIGQPMRTMEPRRFWFENDLAPDRMAFVRELHRRLAPRQLIAGRFMATVIGWLAAAALMVLGWRLVGPVAGIAAYLLLLFHPLFVGISGLCSADAFFILLEILAILFAFELGRASSRGPMHALLWSAVLGVVLGLFLGTKIVAYPLAIMALMAAAAAASDRRALVRSILCGAVALLAGFCLTILLDPGMHASPIAVLWDRFEWRAIRVEIQRIVFPGDRLDDFPSRLAYAVYYFFLDSPQAAALVILCPFGIAWRLRGDGGSAAKQTGTLIIAMALLGFSLVVQITELAWPRYLAISLPLFALLGGAGAEFLWDRLRRVRVLPRQALSIPLLAAVLLGAAAFEAKHIFRRYGWQVPHRPTTKDLEVSALFRFSLAFPGLRAGVHRELMDHFAKSGNRRWYEYQRYFAEMVAPEPSRGSPMGAPTPKQNSIPSPQGGEGRGEGGR